MLGYLKYIGPAESHNKKIYKLKRSLPNMDTWYFIWKQYLEIFIGKTNKQKTLMSKVTLVNIFELVTKRSHPKSKALTSVSGKIQFFPTI